MRLPNAPVKYSQHDLQDSFDLLERQDARNQKKDQDIEVPGAGASIKARRIVLISADGTRYKLEVANGGALSAVAI